MSTILAISIILGQQRRTAYTINPNLQRKMKERAEQRSTKIKQETIERANRSYDEPLSVTRIAYLDHFNKIRTDLDRYVGKEIEFPLRTCWVNSDSFIFNQNWKGYMFDMKYGPNPNTGDIVGDTGLYLWVQPDAANKIRPQLPRFPAYKTVELRIKVFKLDNGEFLGKVSQIVIDGRPIFSGV